jgi:hypothetical protein
MLAMKNQDVQYHYYMVDSKEGKDWIRFVFKVEVVSDGDFSLSSEGKAKHIAKAKSLNNNFKLTRLYCHNGSLLMRDKRTRRPRFIAKEKDVYLAESPLLVT